MTLVKLDSGNYINTMYVIKTMTDTAGSVGKKNGQLVYLLDTGYQKITLADRDRIVEAMGNQQLSNLIKRWEATVADLASDMNDPCDRVEHSTMNMCLRELKVAIQ